MLTRHDSNPKQSSTKNSELAISPRTERILHLAGMEKRGMQRIVRTSIDDQQQKVARMMGFTDGSFQHIKAGAYTLQSGTVEHLHSIDILSSVAFQKWKSNRSQHSG